VDLIQHWNIGWGLTSSCNSKCKHCYNNSGEKEAKEVSFEEAKQIVDKLSGNNVKTINYGTGECGLVDFFWELVKYVHQKNIVQGITTNGYSVNSHTIENIKHFINDVDVSLDYPDKEKNNELRGTNNAWNWAINACDLLKKHAINFSIVTCLHSLNSTPKHIDKFLKICKQYQCEWRINWFKPTGRGKINELLKLKPIIVHDIFRYIVEKTIIIALPNPYFSAIIGLNARQWAPCGMESFRITPSTEVVPCVYFTREIQNLSLLNKSFAEVVDSKKMREVKKRNPLFCQYCEWYHSCRGGCLSRAYLEYNTINAPDAFCFKKTTLKENPLKNLKYNFCGLSKKVHDNYLCTLIVRPI